MPIKQTILVCAFLLLSIVNAGAEKFSMQAIPEQESIVRFAESFLGTPYVYSGNGERGFDCSGFVHYVYKNFGIEVPRISAAYSGFGQPVSLEDCQKGDIILFTGTNYSRSSVGHVGIIISDRGEPVRFIHSSSSRKNRGVTITDYHNSKYHRRYMGIRRP